MKTLLNGLSQYERGTRQRYGKQFASLAGGQVPHTLFVTCADSRVVPNLVASAQPGELFVVRNIANLVPPCGDPLDASVQAAVSFAVEQLGVSEIVVCGHSGCGGIKALLAQPQPDGCLGQWLTHAQPAAHAVRTRGPLSDGWPEHDQVSQVSVLQQLQHLHTYPGVDRRVRSGALNLHAFWFDIASGQVLAYSQAAGRYIPAVEHLALRCGEQSTLCVA